MKGKREVRPHWVAGWLRGVDPLRLNKVGWLIVVLLGAFLVAPPLRMVLRRYGAVSPGVEDALWILAYLFWMAALLAFSTALTNRRAGRLMATAVVALALLMVVAFLTLYA